MTQNQTISTNGIEVRDAGPSDAPSICGILKEIYTPENNGKAEEHYPFPYYLDPNWVADAIRSQKVHWAVAECENRKIVGTVGVVYNKSGHSSHTSEVTSLAVRKTFQRTCGIGSRLMSYINDCLSSHQNYYILAETRTASPGGYSVIRKEGFVPIGYEPFTHHTTDGRESMLMLSKIDPERLQQQTQPARLTDMLSAFKSIVDSSIYRTNRLNVNRKERETNLEIQSNQDAINAPIISNFEILQDNVRGAALKEELSHATKYGSAFLEWEYDGREYIAERFHNIFYVANHNKKDIAYVELLWDAIDRRLRIVRIQSIGPIDYARIILYVINDLTNTLEPSPITTVIDILVEYYDLIVELERLDFIPTVYYPNIVSKNGVYVDGVQYTRVSDSIDCNLFELPQPLTSWDKVNELFQFVKRSIFDRVDA